MSSSSCGCKVALCAQCGACSRCGCDHDGVSVAVKLNRKRGGQGRNRGARGRVKRKRAATAAEHDNDVGTSSDRVIPLHFAGAKLLDLRKTFGIPSEATSHLPPASLRSSVDGDLDALLTKAQVNSSINVIGLCLRRVCEILFPGQPDWCFQKALSSIADAEGLIAVKGSAYDVVSSIVDIDAMLGPYSLQRRALFSVLAGNMSRKQLLKVMRDVDSDRAREDTSGEDDGAGSESILLGKDRFGRGRRDFERLSSGHEISAPVLTRLRFSPDVLDTAIKFILSPNNVITLSWDTKTFNVDGKSKEFPVVMRRKMKSRIVDDYVEAMTDKAKVDKLGSSSMFELVGILTNKESKSKSAVDYVYGILVLDQLTLIRRMISAEVDVDQAQKRKQLFMFSSWLEAFLKHEYVESHVGQPLSPPSHHPTFGLLHSVDGLGTISDLDRDDCAIVSCRGCKAVFLVLQKIASELDSRHGPLFDEISRKFFLFMGHSMRVWQQRHRVVALHRDIRCRPELDTAFISIDFKMKFGHLTHRAKAVEHVGKRGLSWHGALVTYFVNRERLDEDGNVIDSLVSEETMYIDHICASDNAQDALGVLSLSEAIISCVARTLPAIKRVLIQSDNARIYQNSTLPYFFPLISNSTGVFIERFLHTETVDGKGMLDGHFALMMKRVRAYCDAGFNVSRPSQLVAALQYKGGGHNTEVELIRHNRARLRQLEARHRKGIDALQKSLKRMNEIEFSRENPSLLKCWQYSKVGEPRTCHILGHDSAAGADHSEGASEEDVSTNVANGDEVSVDGVSEDDSGNLDSVDHNPSVGPTVLEILGIESNEGAIGGGDDDDSDLDMFQEPRAVSSGADAENVPTTTLTGYTVEHPKALKRRVRRWKIRCDKLCEKETNESKCRQRDGNNVASDEEDILDSDAVCTTCSRSFLSSKFMERHVCKPNVGPRTLVPMAQKRALALLEAGHVEIETLAASDIISEDVIDSMPSLESFVVPHDFVMGWARRPMQGEIYGDTYIEPYKDELRDMFSLGERDKARKMTAELMEANLRQRHPNTYTLPGLPAIDTYISQLVQQRKKSGVSSAAASASADSPPAQQSRRGRKAMYDTKFTDAFQEFISDCDGLAKKPAAAVKWLKEKFGPDLPDRFPTDAQAKAKFSRMRVEFKRSM